MGKPRDGLMSLNMPRDERDRISGQAAARNLSDSAFVRLVVAGAISRGGGTLEQLLAAGESQISTTIRQRMSPNYAKLWAWVGEQQYVRGPWRLYKESPHGVSRNAEDKKNWWWLTNDNDPTFKRPIAFKKSDAITQASQFIDSFEDRAERESQAIDQGIDQGT